MLGDRCRIQSILGIRHQNRGASPELPFDEPGGDLDDPLGLEQSRQLAREFRDCTRPILARGGDLCLVPQAGGEVTDHQRDGEHHGKGQEVLNVGYREGKARRNEKEVEYSNTQK